MATDFSVCRQSLQTEAEEEKRRLIVRSRFRRRTMYGRERERTKAVTASTRVLAVKLYLCIEVPFDYMSYGLFFFLLPVRRVYLLSENL